MRILIFGGSGTIGSACHDLAIGLGHEVIVASRSAIKENFFHLNQDLDNLQQISEPFDAIIWAQGSNTNDTIDKSDDFEEIMAANITFIRNSFRILYQSELLKKPARLVLIGSIWQNLSRENKFSYSVSKSAMLGMVGSLSADFSGEEIITNAVLPGIIMSPMTEKNLTLEQIAKVKSQTPTKSLVSLGELARIIIWLASPDSSGIAGQSITVDNGWSKFREI